MYFMLVLIILVCFVDSRDMWLKRQIKGLFIFYSLAFLSLFMVYWEIINPMGTSLTQYILQLLGQGF